MTTFKNSVNAFGNSAGDDIDEKFHRLVRSRRDAKGQAEERSPARSPISDGNRRLAKAKHGAGGDGDTVRGQNAFSKGGKGK